MAQPRVILAEQRFQESRGSDTRHAWQWIGWFSGVLAFVGLSDFGLAWVPFRFGTPEWEFATVAQTFAGLPLVTIGLAGALAASIVLDKRWLVTTLAITLLFFTLVLFAALGLFLLDVPLALRAAQGPASLGVQKAIVKTVLLGLAFGGTYLASGISALRYMRRERLV